MDYIQKDSAGNIVSLRGNIGFNKSVSLRRNGEYLNIYINDNVFENKQLVKEESKYIWLKWDEAIKLRDALSSIQKELESSDEVSLVLLYYFITILILLQYYVILYIV